jgi:2-amino-4-hydroxy-6-hydroxymethyldihydropteridine diphosphokinase
VAIAYLGLGTNLDDRGANLARALREIERIARIYDVSRIYETAPVGYADQPEFWNLAVRVSTALPPAELMRRLKEIEQRMGRAVTFVNGPRLIDIDILFYNDEIVDEPTLQIPHPRLMQRAFVLRPLAEIAPALTDPRSGRRIQDALVDVSDQAASPVSS